MPKDIFSKNASPKSTHTTLTPIPTKKPLTPTKSKTPINIMHTQIPSQYHHFDPFTQIPPNSSIENLVLSPFAPFTPFSQRALTLSNDKVDVVFTVNGDKIHRKDLDIHGSVPAAIDAIALENNLDLDFFEIVANGNPIQLSKNDTWSSLGFTSNELVNVNIIHVVLCLFVDHIGNEITQQKIDLAEKISHTLLKLPGLVQMDPEKTYFYVGSLNLKRVEHFSWSERVRKNSKAVKINCLNTSILVVFSDMHGGTTRMNMDRTLNVRVGIIAYAQKIQQPIDTLKFTCDGVELDQTAPWNDTVSHNRIGESMNEVNVDVMTIQTGG